MTDPDASENSLNLTSSGVTLIGVLLSIGITVAFGVSGPWWLRVLIGAATTFGLAVLVKLTTSTGRGPLARAAGWVIGRSERDGDRGERG